MDTITTINNWILKDELVNDYEFAEILYGEGFTNANNRNTSAQKLVWADLL
jgi:hypothetical protein